VKALGRCRDGVDGVLDLTAGLARDAALMAAAGYPVSMVERQPVLHALIADALARAQGQGAAALLTLLDNGDAATLTLPAGPWHAVYLDPMFPARGKSAAVKQDLQWLQQLCPYPDDDEERRLLDVALTVPARKVVIKRPRRAPPLAGRAPHHVLEGKTVRFDVYNGMAVNN
jgi:16S rRNA (guanine1516-N2)-methyltransferase